MLIGAAVLVSASLLLVSEAASLRRSVLKQIQTKCRGSKDRPRERARLRSEAEQVKELDIGAFARWYQQPIFAAFISLVAVFGTLNLAEPIVRLMVG